MIAAMCEQFVARAAEPFRLDVLWPLAERMERYGIAGFGWGVTWLGDDGELHATATPARSATTRRVTTSAATRPRSRPRPPPAPVAA